MMIRSMKPDRHSATAVMMAVVRAYHTLAPKPHVFEDAVAPRLVTDAERQTLVRTSTEQARAFDPAFASSCTDPNALVRRGLQLGAAVAPLARARFVEARLEDALAAGATQYVIVGAGLETFAFRRQELATRLRVIEIDHPATSAFKQERVAAAGLATPENLHYVTADLERESVADALARAPFDRAARTFFAWPGVTMYLSREAVLATLASIAKVSASGSRLVFDYWTPAAFAPDAPPRVRFVAERARALGEPVCANLDPATLASDLSNVGLVLASDLGPAEIQAQLLADAPDFRAVECWHFAECRHDS